MNSVVGEQLPYLKFDSIYKSHTMNEIFSFKKKLSLVPFMQTASSKYLEEECILLQRIRFIKNALFIFLCTA